MHFELQKTSVRACRELLVTLCCSHQAEVGSASHTYNKKAFIHLYKGFCVLKARIVNQRYWVTVKNGYQNARYALLFFYQSMGFLYQTKKYRILFHSVDQIWLWLVRLYS